MIVLAPLERDHTETASPAASIATCGSNAFWPASDRSTGVCQTPLAAGRAAACTIVLAPLERAHTATASPAVSIATCGWNAFWPASDRSTGAPKLPPAGRRRLHDEVAAISVRPHRDGVTGRVDRHLRVNAFWPASDRSTGAPKLPPAGRAAACTITLLPLKRVHTATASPAGSIATCGTSAFPPATDRSTGAPKLPPAGRAAACTIVLAPLERSHTATASPAASIATCGSSALWPASDTSTGESQVGAATAGAAHTSTTQHAHTAKISGQTNARISPPSALTYTTTSRDQAKRASRRAAPAPH